MKKIILYALLSISFLVACANKPAINLDPGSSKQAEMKIKFQIEEILKKCVATPGPGESIYNNDAISFVIYQGGFAKNGIAYKSFNTISKPWAYCIEKQVIATDFSPVGQNGEYTYQSSVDWDAALAEHPELLTQKVKVKQAMRNNESQFQSCYKSYHDNGGNEQGKVNIKFDVLPEGKVENVDILSEEIKDQTFLKCVKSTTSKIQFPKTKEILKILYPVIFKL